MNRFWFCLVLTVPTLVRAERALAKRPISLHSTITTAIRQNPALGAVVADVSIADASIKSARGLDDPLIDLQGDWTRNRQQLVENSPLQQPSLDDLQGSVGLTQPLPTGGRVGLRIINRYTRTEFATQANANAGQVGHQDSVMHGAALQVAFDHPLLRGAGVGVARADRRRSAARRDIAGLMREAAVTALVRDVVVSYSDLAYAAGELEVRNASVNAGREQLERVTADIEVGKRPPSGSAEVEVAIGRREEAALLAAQMLAERSLAVARLVGQSIDSGSTDLVAEEALPMPDETPMFDEALAAALEHHPELHAAAARSRATLIEVDVTDSARLPQLDLFLGGGPAGNAGDVGTAYSALSRFAGYTVSAGLILQEPVGRHAATGANDAARWNARRAELGETELRQRISTAVAREITAIDTARRRTVVLARSLRAAALDLESERGRFESGRSTNFDVLRRQDQLALTQLSALAARLDYARARASLEALTSTILTHYKIEVR